MSDIQLMKLIDENNRLSNVRMIHFYDFFFKKTPTYFNDRPFFVIRHTGYNSNF